MFRIRRIYDDVLPVNQTAIAEVGQIFRQQFPAASTKDIDSLPDKLRNPFHSQFRTILLIAENARGHIAGFAIMMHDPGLAFCYLDWLAARSSIRGRGIGAALYEYVRDEALSMGAQGLLFECLPDEPDRCRDPHTCKQNAARLKFYERYGARPIINTQYESPVPGGSADNLPFLVFDDLDTDRTFGREHARRIVRAILERKYASLCPPDYIQSVVNSFRDDPIRLREFRYAKSEPDHKPAAPKPPPSIAWTINDKHQIHHIRERGYVESPVRISAITAELEPTGLFEKLPVKEYPLKHILAVHDAKFVDYLERACANAPESKSVYPYVFPIRNATRPPREMSVLAGYYCIDTFTPIHRNAWPAARRAVDCTLTAAEQLLKGCRLAYALVRPPGHHAERRSFGGFCYFNNAAVAANLLAAQGRVAILDVDYHHGNGQQDIFYERADVLTVSIHGDPDFAYPYFTGFADEQGYGLGEGYNFNIPLPETQDGPQYRKALERALKSIARFDPAFLVLCLGLDPAKGDPTGTWSLSGADFEANGRLIGALGLPTLIVQEGGYRTRTLGQNARRFFHGLTHAAYGR